MLALRTRFSSIALLALLAFIICGCRPNGNIVGHWQANLKSHDTGAKNNALAQGLTKMFQALMTIDFRADHTFTLTILVPIEGTWSESGNEVTLTPSKVSGQPATDNSGKPMTLKLSPDGQTLTAEDSSGGQPLTFTKQLPASS